MATDAETFRAARWLRASVILADGLWTAVLVTLFKLGGVSPATLASAAFFVLLFSVALVAYTRQAYTAGPEALEVRTVRESRAVRYRDIVAVEVVPGLLGPLYAVRLRRGPRIWFSSWLSDHRRLCEVIVRRAGLSSPVA